MRRNRRHLALLGAAPATIGSLLIAPAASAGIITPESGGSPNADHIAGLYNITLYIAIVIFVLVEGALLYACFKFRARKGAAAAQIHGNTNLELGWTVGAAVVLFVLAVITFVQLNTIRTPPNSGPNGYGLASSSAGGVLYATTERELPPNGRSLNIKVNGQQYLWRYTYPGGSRADGLDNPYAYEEMVVPTNTTVTLDINAQDVVHSWWIPQLGGKFQAVPGYTNHTWFKISKPGIYGGQCAFLCGRNHARMIADVRAVAPAQFEAWLAQRKADIAAANSAAQASRTRLNSKTGPQSVQNP
ncbi:MAG: cytochrome c oxidase subunit II [Solirubrobacteraceae bacterium]